MNIIEAEKIVKQYASHRALDEVSLSIPEGSIYGLMGPNGAGKTTLIRIINRITAPDSGHLLFEGHDITSDDVLKIGYLPEERGLYKKMKVGEQALYLSRLKGLSRHDAMVSLRKWFRRFEIEGWWDKKVEELSKGMAQKVQFIVTVIHNPKLLIFDEPFSGFDPINANLLKEEILDRARQGATVIFSTHNMSSVEEICDHITLINKSKNILSGNVEHIRRSMANNSFRIDFTGDSEPLISKLSQMGSIDECTTKNNLHSLTITLPLCSSPRQIIETANEMANIRTFTELIPSMNQIFIKTVQQYELQ